MCCHRPDGSKMPPFPLSRLPTHDAHFHCPDCPHMMPISIVQIAHTCPFPLYKLPTHYAHLHCPDGPMWLPFSLSRWPPYGPSFSFSSRWHRSARKGPYALRPVSQQSPQGCPRNSANIGLVEHRSFSALEGGMSAASFLHSSFL